MILRRIEKYHFCEEYRSNLPGTFTFSLTQDFYSIKEDKVLAELSGILTVKRRRSSCTGTGMQRGYLYYACDLQDDAFFDDAQHYDAFPMPDGNAYAVEAVLNVKSPDHPEWQIVRVGISQSRIPQGEHTLTLHCDGITLLLLLDGVVMDEAFLYGTFSSPPENPVLPENARFYSPALLPEITVSSEKTETGIQYFSTFSDNSWVGDVVPFVHDGTVHLFYLLDRRHHGNKFGTGAHYYGHLSSTDLKNWTEHPAIGKPEHQWETCGTGTPFVHNGKFYFAYGLHTDRYTPYEKNAGKILRDCAEQSGIVSPVKFQDLEDRLPEGMTYAVSDDGIRFRKSRVLTHFSENPSVYVMPDGTLKMYADGIWTADRVDGIWKRVSSGFPPSGKDSAMRNTLECPSFFEWNGTYYLLVGMDGFFRSETPDFEEYTDLSAAGRDIYDGLVVPMVIPWRQDRRLIAGWIFPFGSFLVIRELVQFSDHDLGSKWCPELMPPVRQEKPVSFPERLDESEKDVIYTWTLDGSSGGKFAVQLTDKHETVEFQIDVENKSAQMETVSGSGQWFAPLLPSIRERVSEWIQKHDIESFKEMPMDVKFKCHVFSRDFRLENLRGLDGVFTVKFRIWREPKMPSVILDAEIAGMRTMVSCRPRFNPGMISVKTCGGIQICSGLKTVC